MLRSMKSVGRLTAICPQNVRNLSAPAGQKLVLVDVDDKTGYATVTMNRPPVNSLNLELLAELNTALDDLQNNRSRGMILSSSAPTVFSAGLDIMEMYKPNQERLKEFWTNLQDVWLKLYGSPFPTAAAIHVRF
jgi:Delta3-Delta2-enoyl-CoA isomerase